MSALQHPLLDSGQRYFDTGDRQEAQVNLVPVCFEFLYQCQIASTGERGFEGEGSSALRKELNLQSTGSDSCSLRRKREIPSAMRSALTKFLQFAYFGRNLRANVVLPIPFGAQ